MTNIKNLLEFTIEKYPALLARDPEFQCDQTIDDYTREELIQAILDYYEPVGEQEGVSFVSYINNKTSKDIVRLICE